MSDSSAAPRQAADDPLGRVTVEDFDQYLNGTFRFSSDERSVEVQLIDCRRLSAPGASTLRRDPFSVVFRGPMEPFLPQGVYRVEHEQMKKMDVFLVPLGPDGEGMRYEAIFT